MGYITSHTNMRRIHVGCISIFVLLAGCKKDLETTTASTRSSSLPAATPIPSVVPVSERKDPIAVEGGFGETRLYYQTRSIITLKLAQDLVPSGSSFSLVNESNGKTLIEKETVALPLMTTEQGFGFLSLSEGYDVLLRIYPLDESFLGKIAYGENKLRILVDDGQDSRFSTTTIGLQDFDMQGVSIVAGEEGGSGGGMEFWMNASSRPVVSGVTTLTTGQENIIND